MEKSIYILLEKHFQQNTNQEEEQQIEQFKQRNLQEYLALKNRWQNNAIIRLTDFDSEKAWKTVSASQAIQKPMLPLRRIAGGSFIVVNGIKSILAANNKQWPHIRG